MERPGRRGPAGARARARALAAASATAATALSCRRLQASDPSTPNLAVALVLGISGGNGSGAKLQVLVSKVLSLGVVAGALVGKLPQVYAIWRARSAAGVSALSIWMEALSLGVQLAYNVVRKTPFSTYAEVPILFLQLILLALTAAWADGYLGGRVWVGSLGLVLGSATMALKIVPPAVTAALYAANAALGLAVIGPQLLMTCRNRSTGQLSFVVALMTFSGITTRLFTTLVEVDDLGLRLSVCLNWLLMAVLLAQFILYRPRSKVAPTAPVEAEKVQELKEDEDRPVAAVGLTKRLHRRHNSLVDIASKLGSSRCLYLLGEQALEEPVARGLEGLRNKSWDGIRPPVERLRRSFHSFQGLL